MAPPAPKKLTRDQLYQDLVLTNEDPSSQAVSIEKLPVCEVDGGPPVNTYLVAYDERSGEPGAYRVGIRGEGGEAVAYFLPLGEGQDYYVGQGFTGEGNRDVTDVDWKRIVSMRGDGQKGFTYETPQGQLRPLKTLAHACRSGTKDAQGAYRLFLYEKNKMLDPQKCQGIINRRAGSIPLMSGYEVMELAFSNRLSPGASYCVEPLETDRYQFLINAMDYGFVERLAKALGAKFLYSIWDGDMTISSGNPIAVGLLEAVREELENRERAKSGLFWTRVGVAGSLILGVSGIVGGYFIAKYSINKSLEMMGKQKDKFKDVLKNRFENLTDKAKDKDGKMVKETDGLSHDVANQVIDRVNGPTEAKSAVVEAPAGWGKKVVGDLIVTQSLEDPNTLYLETTADRLLADTAYFGDREGIRDAVLKEVRALTDKGYRVVLSIDEIHIILTKKLSSGEGSTAELMLQEWLQPLADGRLTIVGYSTPQDMAKVHCMATPVDKRTPEQLRNFPHLGYEPQLTALLARFQTIKSPIRDESNMIEVLERIIDMKNYGKREGLKVDREAIELTAKASLNFDDPSQGHITRVAKDDVLGSAIVVATARNPQTTDSVHVTVQDVVKILVEKFPERAIGILQAQPDFGRRVGLDKAMTPGVRAKIEAKRRIEERRQARVSEASLNSIKFALEQFGIEKDRIPDMAATIYREWSGLVNDDSGMVGLWQSEARKSGSLDSMAQSLRVSADSIVPIEFVEDALERIDPTLFSRSEPPKAAETRTPAGGVGRPDREVMAEELAKKIPTFAGWSPVARADLMDQLVEVWTTNPDVKQRYLPFGDQAIPSFVSDLVGRIPADTLREYRGTAIGGAALPQRLRERAMEEAVVFGLASRATGFGDTNGETQAQIIAEALVRAESGGLFARGDRASLRSDLDKCMVLVDQVVTERRAADRDAVRLRKEEETERRRKREVPAIFI